jgi:hypothetical protein
VLSGCERRRTSTFDTDEKPWLDQLNTNPKGKNMTEALPWESDPATQAQLEYITLRNMVPRDQLKGLTKGEAFNIIRAYKEQNKTPSEDLATDPQVNYIKKLCSELGIPAGTYFTSADGKIPKRRASVVITELKSRLSAPIETTEGLYKVGMNIYKVKRDRWGSLVCQKMIKLTVPEEVSNGVRTHKFVTDSSMIRALANMPQMTMDEAKEFAQDSSACVRCGIALDPLITNEDGSKRWIGPVCQQKMGW